MPQVATVTPNRAAIRAARLELVLTPEELAQRMGGRHPSTIRGMENGRITKVGELLMHQLARALGKPVEELTLQDVAA